jgi:putative membrane protein
MSPKLKEFLFRWANNTIGVVVATYLVHGIQYHAVLDLFVAALFLGVLNAFVRPLMMLVSLPLLVLTLGLFTLVINALLLYFVGWLLTPRFNVADFRAAFWGALVITIVSLILNRLTGTSNVRVRVQRGGPPPPRNPPDGDGPVNDV